MTVLIKPASSICNMRCRYCFYCDISSHREEQSYGIMTDDITTALIDKVLAYADGGSVSFVFQGGEPLIAGIRYFENFIYEVKTRNTKKSLISYSLQTNSTLIDDAFCILFRDSHFLLGVSVDGKSGLHNMNRVTKDGKGTFNKVMQSIDLLKKYNIDFNILCVVTKQAAKQAQAIYGFFAGHGIRYMQFITCLEPFGSMPLSTSYAMNNDEYFCFYRTLFDLYYEDRKKGIPVYVRYFDNLLSLIHGQTPEMCGMTGRCAVSLTVEANGNCYPCDFYCDDSHLMGSITDMSLEQLSASDTARDFILKSLRVDDACRQCDVYDLCRGGCRRERDQENNGDLHLNMYCEGRKRLLRYVMDKLKNG
ncbi:MAG: radical SAM protein [Clostridia bacterium]